MAAEYLTIKETGKGEYEEKKSRFLGEAIHVETEEEASAHVARIRRQYYDARHHCYAWVIGEGSERKKSADDGEPSGTAGQPILKVIEGSGCTNVMVIVTRYFGGVLLGASGLVRAYSQACSLAVSAAKKMVMCECSRLSFSCDYTLYGKVSYLLPEYGVINEKEDFADTVNMAVLVRAERADDLKKKLTDVSGGQLQLLEDTDLWANFADKL